MMIDEDDRCQGYHYQTEPIALKNYTVLARAIKRQSCKLLRHLGTRCPVGLEASSRMFRVNPAIFVVSRIWGVIHALFVAIFSKILLLLISLALGLSTKAKIWAKAYS